MKNRTLKCRDLLATLSVVACLLMAGSMTYAQPSTEDSPRQQRRQGQGEGRQARGEGHGHKGPFGDMFKELELSEEQRTQVKEVMQKHRDQVEAFREKNGDQIKKVHQDMRSAMMNKDYDAAHKVIDQIKELDKDRPTFSSVLTDFKGILSSEQLAVVEKKIEEIKNNPRPKRMRKRHGDSEQGNAEDGRRFGRRNRQKGESQPASLE